MKKSYKCLILLGAATVAMGTSMIPLNNPIKKDAIQREMQAYNHKPNSMVDNVFRDNNDIILPIIFEDPQQTISEETMKSEFKKAGLTVKEISTKGVIGTGTKITVNENSNVYTVLIYGDVDGDGEVNLLDARTVILHRRNPDNSQLKGIYLKAANVGNQDTETDLYDARRIIRFRRNLFKKDEVLIEVEPQSAKELDSVKPVITLRGEKTITVQVGGKYTDAGATANDNYDGDLTSKIVKTGTVDSSKVGTYTIKYNVTDSNGNKADEVVRTVKVVDTTKPVITLKGNKEVTVQVGGTYTDEGVTASDNYDGNITNKVVKTGTVDTATVGTYTIRYNVTDSNGNKADEVVRTVKVVDTTKPVITLDQTNVYSMEVNSTKPTFKATATDNYDKTVTVNITDNIKTNQVGKYTVTFTAKDSSNNTATMTKEFEVTDKIQSIEMASQPQVKDYDYGTTKIDITGAQIKVNWVSGNSSNMTITESMIKTYDLTQTGTNTITVEYGGKQTSFEVNVHEKITALELIDTGRENVVEEAGGYKVDSKTDFILGTIRAVQSANVSTLKIDQVEINNPNIQKELDAQGNILLKGKIADEGSCVIEVSIKYGEQKVAYNINLQVVKSKKVKDVSLEAIVDGEVKYNRLETIKKALTITNINDEEIDLLAKDLNITVPSQVVVTKLDENKDPIVDEDTIHVKYLEITTTLKTVQDVQITLAVENTTVSKDISFKTGNESVLSKVTLGQTQAKLHTEVNADVLDKDGNIYTVLPIDFYNQDNEKMGVEASNVTVHLEGTNIDDLLAQDGKVCIIKPKGKENVTIGNQTIPRDGNALHVILLDKDGNIASGATEVAKIGVSILLNAQKNIVLSSIEGKEILVKTKNQAEPAKLSLSVAYKEISKFQLNTTGVQLPSVDGDGNYVIKLNTETVFGKLQVGEYEGPLTKDMIKTEITPASAQGKVEVSYDYDSNNNIVLKVNASEDVVCQVRAYIEKANGSKLYARPVQIKAQGVPNISSIELGNTNLEIGRTLETPIKAISDLNPAGEPIKLKDIKIDADGGIKVEPLDESRDPIPEGYGEYVVSYLRVTTTETADVSKNIRITLYEGQENEYPTTKTIEVYRPVPRVIEIQQTATLYENENADTVTVGDNVYSVLKLKAYADTAKTKPVTLTADMLQKLGTTGDPEKIFITSDKLSINMKLSDTVTVPRDTEVIDVAYFSGKNAVTTGEIDGIGVAIKTLPQTYEAYDRTRLNGLQVHLQCVDSGETVNITMSYDNN